MRVTRLLIANRGEVAIRIARAAAALGIVSVAAFSRDDAESLHVRIADEAVPLPGSGPAAYLDADELLAAAAASACDAVHPGYGFLSENASFAQRCIDAGLTFAGPRPDVLEVFGDKARARALARSLHVPLLAGSDEEIDLDGAAAFLASLGDGGTMMIKAVAGGGGRGIRMVSRPEHVADAFARARAEALAAFGHPGVYVERFVRRARHVEIQIAGDESGEVSHLWERDCTLQRRNQKLVEVAPAPGLSPALRARLIDAALSMARATRHDSLGTFEFLIDTEATNDATSFAFIEANPRLQVEHTVTEAVTGVDLVVAQLRIARGATLAELGLQLPPPSPRGIAVQVRVNLETMATDGEVVPASGTLTVFEPPAGPGVRVDTFGYGGYRTNPSFDSLLAKVIVHAPEGDFAHAAAFAARTLREFRIAGVATNLPFLSALLHHPDVAAYDVYTGFIAEHARELAAESKSPAAEPHVAATTAVPSSEPPGTASHGPPNTAALRVPTPGKLLTIDVAVGAPVARGQRFAVLEAMKMEHVLVAELSGIVRAIAAQPGTVLDAGDPVLFVEPAEVELEDVDADAHVDLDELRADLAEVVERRHAISDNGRPDAVAKRRALGRRTARENLAHLFDGGDFLEYGEFAVAAQRRRREPAELERMSPADGLIAGIGQINGDRFGEERSRCIAMAYDYTVFAGTQGYVNHQKTDRMLSLAERWRVPLVMFTEGGGGRPGDTDVTWASGLAVPTFASYARLSGLVPVVGIVAGYCFAGNAAFLGCSDVIIATRDANIGMGGPAMIEGGGLGTYRPEEIGPVSDQAPNGVIDVVAENETDATEIARKYLSYFQGAVAEWTCADQRELRRIVPENRVRVYDVHKVITTLADDGSVLELRAAFAPGMITALIRIEGKPFGLIANNPMHLGGAIDGAGADKASRFMQLCDAFDLPVVTLCDTPGFAVGPDVERTGQVRRVSRMFVTAASMTVPVFFVALRKGYGLGAQAMAAGSLHEPFFSVAWPSGEFGPMGLEGAVRLGYRKELAAIENPQERQAAFDAMVAQSYAQGKALNVASVAELDSVIDPRDTRTWIIRGLRAVPAPPPRQGKKRPSIDTW
ncbi:MAG: carbamoyl-phosphate synthase large subunit [Candidatus Eremiobacteraeota bacterium]|nr:carbamoyl-phosphate synthase large subunit [Candidatus Eremiobacteraeota bacterium]